MGFFNFVETFFFISLAITFVLIMMLVYHFKERLSALEKKSNTIVDIINNVVKEITFMKYQPVESQQNGLSSFSQNPLTYAQIKEEESDDDSSESDGDSTSYEDLGEEDEEVEDSIHVVEVGIENRENSVNYEEESENIKRININLSAPTNNVLDDLEDIQDIQEIDSEEIYLEDKIENVEVNEDEVPIVINKIDEPNESNLEDVKDVNPNDVEIYRKMEIGALRTLVISKGLVSDTKKMKKSELIRLLESDQE